MKKSASKLGIAVILVVSLQSCNGIELSKSLSSTESQEQLKETALSNHEDLVFITHWLSTFGSFFKDIGYTTRSDLFDDFRDPVNKKRGFPDIARSSSVPQKLRPSDELYCESGNGTIRENKYFDDNELWINEFEVKGSACVYSLRRLSFFSVGDPEILPFEEISTSENTVSLKGANLNRGGVGSSLKYAAISDVGANPFDTTVPTVLVTEDNILEWTANEVRFNVTSSTKTDGYVVYLKRFEDSDQIFSGVFWIGTTATSTVTGDLVFSHYPEEWWFVDVEQKIEGDMKGKITFAPEPYGLSVSEMSIVGDIEFELKVSRRRFDKDQIGQATTDVDHDVIGFSDFSIVTSGIWPNVAFTFDGIQSNFVNDTSLAVEYDSIVNFDQFVASYFSDSTGIPHSVALDGKYEYSLNRPEESTCQPSAVEIATIMPLNTSVFRDEFTSGDSCIVDGEIVINGVSSVYSQAGIEFNSTSHGINIDCAELSGNTIQNLNACATYDSYRSRTALISKSN